ncbi:ISAzo13 family transposase, partial [Nostocaceae cyanobacterium CENA369]|nr:ISAzo13 family transposase [Dendronalium phyllosphericum CENA369]
MSNNQEIKSIQGKYDLLSPYLNEKTRRIWAAIEAQSLGWGGISQVALATGLSRTTIHAGIRLLLDASEEETSNGDSNRIRSSGAG